jgi:hypothetical protein
MADKFTDPRQKVLYQPNSYKVSDSVWNNCSYGTDRNLWVVVTRVKATPVTAYGNAPTVPDDIDLAFSSYRGDEPPVPPGPKRPTKNVTISNLRDTSKQNDTFMINPLSLVHTLNPSVPKADKPVTLTMEGVYQKDFGKTGLWAEVWDTIGERMYYQNHFYNRGNSNYTAGNTYKHQVQWLFPAQFTASDYEVKVLLKDWIHPEAPEIASIQFSMRVKDVIA